MKKLSRYQEILTDKLKTLEKEIDQLKRLAPNFKTKEAKHDIKIRLEIFKIQKRIFKALLNPLFKKLLLGKKGLNL